MGLLVGELERHLTNPDPSLQSARLKTVPGMAHFGGSGPPGNTCRLCAHWTGCGKESGYYARKGMGGGGLKPRSCAKYRSMMGDIGPAIPHDISACKHFEINEAPPAISAKGG